MKIRPQAGERFSPEEKTVYVDFQISVPASRSPRGSPQLQQCSRLLQRPLPLLLHLPTSLTISEDEPTSTVADYDLFLLPRLSKSKLCNDKSARKQQRTPSDFADSPLNCFCGSFSGKTAFLNPPDTLSYPV